MKLLLVSANRERSPYPVFPIGLACLSTPLAAAGHGLSALDLCFEPEPERALTEAIDRLSPDAVLLSVRNVDNVTWPDSRSYIEGVRLLAETCREKALLIVGGSGFSLMPEVLMKEFCADYGVVGEGEEVLPRLLECVERNEDAGTLPGVLVKGREGFLPPRPAVMGTPDRGLFDLARYRREGGMANIQTKRGCPFSCVYCTYPLLEGSRVRVRPPAEVTAEVRDLYHRCGIDYLYFVDDIFNYPVEYAEELCSLLTAERLPVKWSAFINPSFVTPRLLDLMAAAGCDALEFGTDSGSPVMLKSLGKSFGRDDILEASRRCTEAGLDFAHYILFGGPGENAETVEESFRTMDEAAPTAVIGMVGIRIFPGTPLCRRALDEGLVLPGDPLLEPVFYLSEEERRSLAALVAEKALVRKNWVVPGLEINTSDAMLEALRHFAVKGPLWKLMKRLGRSRINPLSPR